MIRSQVFLRAVVASVVSALLASPAHATSWGPRDDVGVAAVDTRTGKVLWEVWRLDEVPAGASKEEKTAVEYLLAVGKYFRGPLPRVPLPRVSQLPDALLTDMVIKNPWPIDRTGMGIAASEGKGLIFYRHGIGVIAFDRQTKKEVWRLETTRDPYLSQILEAGENQALIQIGSYVPATLHTSLVGGLARGLRMEGLEPHSLKQRFAAAVLLHHYGDGYLRPEVQRLVKQLREEKDDPAAATAAKAIEKRLADWPKKRDRQRLLEGCVASLLETDGGDPFKDAAWPGAHRVLAWCLLQELLYGSPRGGYSRQGYNYAYGPWDEIPLALSDATKAKLANHCRKVVGEGPDAEKPFAASVLVSTGIGWGKLTDAERKKLFLSSDPSVWRWAALALTKDCRRKDLMEWVRERPADDHLDVVWLLKRDREGWPEEELKFCVACARHDAGHIADVLRNSGAKAPIEFREPIRAYLQREIAKPTVKDGGTQPAYSLSAALNVLETWKNPDDTPLLQEYLKHPVYSTVISSKREQRTEVHTYELRGLARSLLEKRGVKVPPGVVYEEVGQAKE